MSDGIKSFLKFVSLDELDYWDVKRYVITDIHSKFTLIKLSNLIQERSEKVKLFEEPEKLFGILGVNNKIGLFDAYEQYGNEINQAYKKVYDGDLAYNPYRINVGSIGLKTKELKNNFISPAYVVFSSNENLNPNYLYKIFKTDTFNKIINDNTTGSVRQNLKFDTLSNIKIPLPTIDEQNKLLEKYNTKIALAQSQEQEAKEIEQSIEEYLFEELGIEKIEEKKKSSKLQFVESKNLDRWDTLYLIGNIPTLKSKYKIVKFSKIITYFNKSNNDESLRINSKDYPNESFIYIGMEHIEKETGTLLEINNVKGKEIKSQTLKVPSEYILFGKLRPYLNKYWINNLDKNNIICSSEFFVFDIEKSMNKLFFKYCLSSNFIQMQITDKTSGARMPRINEDTFMSLDTPLPPIDIQDKIATEITKRKEKIKQLKQQALKNREDAIKEFEEEIFTK